MVVAPIGQMIQNNFLPFSKVYSGNEEVSVLNTGEKKKKIVIVESSVHSCDFLFEFLSLSYHCYVSANGTEGCVLIDGLMPDLVILEALMPPLDGYELCEKIRQNSKTCHIPIILLISEQCPEHIIAGYEKGADACVPKPFKMTILDAQISQLIKSRELIRESCSGQNSIPETFSYKEKSDDKFMAKLRQLMENRIADPDFQIPALTSELNMSYTTLYRKIKSLTGLSPVELVMYYKMQKAYQLLSSSDSVKAIGIELGFRNLSYFSKCFKKQFGVTPTVVRQNSI